MRRLAQEATPDIVANPFGNTGAGLADASSVLPTAVLAVWTPFLYIEALIPGTSLLASADVPVLRLGGVSLPPNLAVAWCWVSAS